MQFAFCEIIKTSDASAIEPEDGEAVEYLIPKGRHLTVQEGDTIEKGEYLIEGNPAPQDILAIKGMEELATFLIDEVQEVYRLQGRDH